MTMAAWKDCPKKLLRKNIINGESKAQGIFADITNKTLLEEQSYER